MTPEQAAVLERYTQVRAVEAAGAWIGFTVCLKCGAAIYLDPDNRVDIYATHEAFHARVDPR
jgi:hypothetical protein